MPPAARRRRRGVIEDRPEDRERSVLVVEDLEQAALLRPVGLGGDADRPEAAGAGRVGKASTVFWCEWPATQAITFGWSWRSALQVVAEVDRRRVARVEVAARVGVVAVRVGRAVQAGASSSGTSAVRLGIAWWEKRTTSSLAASAAVELCPQPLELRVVDVAVGRRADHAGLGDGVDRDEPDAGLGAPRVVAGRAPEAVSSAGSMKSKPWPSACVPARKISLYWSFETYWRFGSGGTRRDLASDRREQRLDRRQVEPGDVLEGSRRSCRGRRRTA